MSVAARRRLAHDRFGHIPGVPVGTFWASRQECSRARVHAPFVAGISGTKERGAYSIVLSGVSGYEDDVDEGDRIIYTGSGGRAKDDQSRSGPQIQHQSFSDARNASLLKSRETGNPVRVVRGAELRSDFAPPGGDCKYRYDGLYTVTNAWLERGRSGYDICRFELQRLPDQPEVPIRGSTYKVRSTKRRRERDFTPIPEPKFEGIPIPSIPQAGPSSVPRAVAGEQTASSTGTLAASSLPAQRADTRARVDTSLTARRVSDTAPGPSGSRPVAPRPVAQGAMPARAGPSSPAPQSQTRPLPSDLPSRSLSVHPDKRQRDVWLRQIDTFISASPAQRAPQPKTHSPVIGTSGDLSQLKFTKRTDL